MKLKLVELLEPLTTLISGSTYEYCENLKNAKRDYHYKNKYYLLERFNKIILEY